MENNADLINDETNNQNNTESVFDSFDNNVNLTDKEVFLQIWTSPRKVFKFIIENNYRKNAYLLLFLGGVVNALSRSAEKSSGDGAHMLFYIIGAVLGGGLLGWIGYYIYSALLSWTGKWFKGTANTSTLFNVFTYSLIPAVFTLFILIFELSLNRNGVFQDGSDFSVAQLPVIFLLLLMYLIQMVLGAWSLVLLVIGISEAQKFSVGKAILNFLMPVLIIFVPVLIIVLLINS